MNDRIMGNGFSIGASSTAADACQSFVNSIAVPGSNVDITKKLAKQSKDIDDRLDQITENLHDKIKTNQNSTVNQFTTMEQRISAIDKRISNYHS